MCEGGGHSPVLAGRIGGDADVGGEGTQYRIAWHAERVARVRYDLQEQVTDFDSGALALTGEQVGPFGQATAAIDLA